jgi:ATP-dependent DNA helicase PIF1
MVYNIPADFKVHVMMQAWSVKGGQTKYAGHCCNFIRDTAKIVTKVPLLPEDIDILIIRPKDQESNDQLSLASSDCFRLRRQVVMDNIRVLQQSHPSFRNGRITIDWDILNTLPEDTSVYDRIRNIIEVEESSENLGPNDMDHDDNQMPNIVSDGFVPHLHSTESEMTELRNGLHITEAVLTMPPLHHAPINEHDPTLRYIIDAFPLLFPTGEADIHQPRPHPVSDHIYFRHLIRYHDGRFATDPRFRYFALNSTMRWDAKKRSRIYSKRNPKDGAMTVGN